MILVVLGGICAVICLLVVLGLPVGAAIGAGTGLTAAAVAVVYPQQRPPDPWAERSTATGASRSISTPPPLPHLPERPPTQKAEEGSERGST